MAKYSVNPKAVARARRLIEAHQYVIDSDWSAAQPTTATENLYLENHDWDDYGEWHLAITNAASDETKGRYAFVYGDFRRLHRMGLVACQYRAAEWNHMDIEQAAHELLQYLDEVRTARKSA